MSNQRFSIVPAAAAVDLELTDSVFRTLSVIAMYGDKNGWCWPSQSTVAELRCVSRKTINIHIKNLIASGYLNIQPRYDEETGAQKSNMMQIIFDRNYDVTGGVTSKTLQGGGSPEGYRGGEVQEVTQNAPYNAPIEHIYIPPDTDQIASLKTAVACVVKTPYWEKTENEYDKFAYMLEEWEQTPGQVTGFAKWWEKNRHYSGKPALMSMVSEYQNYMAGVVAAPHLNGNGSTAVTLWDSQVANWRNGSLPFANLDTTVQEAIRHIGGDSLRKADSYTISEAKKQFLAYMGKHEASNSNH